MDGRILIVEDDPAVLEFELQVVRKLGFEAIAAQDGLRGWEIAKRERPDAILLDVKLPGCDGLSLARRLRTDTATRQIPIAVVTGNPEDCGFSSGSLMYLAKPFTIRALQIVVLNLLAQKKSAPKVPVLGRVA